LALRAGVGLDRRMYAAAVQSAHRDERPAGREFAQEGAAAQTGAAAQGAAKAAMAGADPKESDPAWDLLTESVWTEAESGAAAGTAQWRLISPGALLQGKCAARRADGWALHVRAWADAMEWREAGHRPELLLWWPVSGHRER
jgi:hypothetical protein